jgi:ankyrin repeat protein
MAQFDAARKGDLQVLHDTLTPLNVNDVDWDDVDSRNVLHHAVKNGHLECVSYCVEMHADVNAHTFDGETSFHLVSLDGYPGRLSIIRVLLDAGATVDTTNSVGSTPLHYASRKGYVDVVCVLLDGGATVDATTNYGETPLYNAIRDDHHRNTAKLLIDRGANVSNVKLDEDVPTISDWITIFIASRSLCCDVAVVVIGIHKYHRTNVTANNNINVLKLIGKHIWATRMDDGWSALAIETTEN